MVKSIFATLVIGSFSLQAFAAPPMFRSLSRTTSHEADVFLAKTKLYDNEAAAAIALKEDLKKLSKSKDAEVQVIVMHPNPPPPPGRGGGTDGWDNGSNGPKKPSKNGSSDIRPMTHKELNTYLQYIVTNRGKSGVVAQEKFREVTLGDTIFRAQDSLSIENSIQKSLTTVQKKGSDLEVVKKWLAGPNTEKTTKMTLDASNFGGDVVKFSIQGDRLNAVIRKGGKVEEVTFGLPTAQGEIKNLQVVGRQSLTTEDLRKMGLYVGMDMKELKAEKGQLFRSKSTTSPVVHFESKNNGVQ